MHHRQPLVSVAALCALACGTPSAGWDAGGCGTTFPAETPLVVGAQATLRVPLPSDERPRPVTVVSDAPSVLEVRHVSVLCRPDSISTPRPCAEISKPLVEIQVEVHARRRGVTTLRAPADGALFPPLGVRVEEAHRIEFQRDDEVINSVTAEVDHCVALQLAVLSEAGEFLISSGATTVDTEDGAIATHRRSLGLEVCGCSPGETALVVSASAAVGRLPVRVVPARNADPAH